MPAQPVHRIVVIGAGICGLASAIWLARAGHCVTLIDRDHPGAGASSGNAGLLAQWAVVPVNTPGIARTGLKYLADPRAPLFLQWAHLPRLLPWLLKFAANATDAEARRAAAALGPLLSDSLEQHRALTRGTAAAAWIAGSDLIYAYDSRADYEADAYSWALKREAGYVPDLIEGHAVQEAEPMLGPAIRCLARLKGHGHILNPGAYMESLAQVLKDEGGSVLQAEVRDVDQDAQGRIRAVLTDQGALHCDRAVLAAGIWSKPLMRKLGVRVPLEPERGHHLHFHDPAKQLRAPLMIVRGKFAATPMAHGLRCAGTVELGGTDARPSQGPLALIRREVRRVFPNLRHAGAEEWVGFRPSTPDSLPLIGEVGGTGVFAAFGHQHVGLTAGPKTGRIVANLIGGAHPNIDLEPFDANRFT